MLGHLEPSSRWSRPNVVCKTHEHREHGWKVSQQAVWKFDAYFFFFVVVSLILGICGKAVTYGTQGM